MASIFIATPCYGHQLLSGYLTSYVKTERALRERGHTVTLSTPGNESLITRARNNLAAHFLGTTHDILMFIDADISWSPQALLDLVDSPHDVCGVPYPTKAYNWKKIVELVNEPKAERGKLTERKLHDYARIYTINELKGAPAEPKLPAHWRRVSALGTGFLMIRRPVLEKMRAHYWDSLHYVNDVAGYKEECKPEHCVALFDTMIHPRTRRYLSEDYAFCKRWRDIGGEIHACLKHRLIHTGTTSF